MRSRLVVLIFALCAGVLGCVGGPNGGSGDSAASGNLLADRRPISQHEVARADAITDGVVAKTGDPWATDLTAVFSSTGSYVKYDLGRSYKLRAAILQGDNNDEYSVSVSEDDATYKPLWTAGSVGGGGVQTRFSPELDATGRYVRLAVAGGDRSFSVSELQVFEVAPADVPPPNVVREGLEVGEAVRGQILLFALALLAYTLLAAKRAPKLLYWASLALPLVAGYALWHTLAGAWPVSSRDVAFVRATFAGLAAIVLAREAWVRGRLTASKGAVVGVLGVCAAMSMAAFYNLGNAQFWDHKEDRPGYVHNFDMHVYYPVAKYFRELRFDGLYLASMAAYQENTPGTTLSSLGYVELRDLRNHRVTRFSDVLGQVPAIKARFSQERWETFKKDVRYFHENMGNDFLRNMTDHGGNATPVWLAIAHVLFAHTEASNRTLLLSGLLDPLLLLLLYTVVWRTFGIRTALMTAIMFGANDFYMFGTDWAGATLRHDWLAYLGLGICALKREKWKTGGALLALSAMIRAFPALALVWTGVPVAFWIWDHRRRQGRLPDWRAWRDHVATTPLGPFVKIAIGAASAAAVLFVFSGIVFSFDAWIDWLHKVSMLDRDPHVNDVSLRCLIAGAGGFQVRILRARWLVFGLVALGYAAAAFAACRKRRFDQAAVFGSMLIPVVFNPANYYVHFICVIPLLAAESRRDEDALPAGPVPERDVLGWLVLLTVCAAQYWTVLDTDTELHFQHATVIFFFALAVLLVTAVFRRQDLPANGAAAPPPDAPAPDAPTPDAPAPAAAAPA
jgi:hypothetical protein